MLDLKDLKPVNLSSTNATDIVAASDFIRLVGWVQVVENAGSGSTIIIDVYDGTTAYPLGDVMTVAAAEVLREEWDSGLPLPKGWSLRATAGNANRLTVIAALAQI